MTQPEEDISYITIHSINYLTLHIKIYDVSNIILKSYNNEEFLIDVSVNEFSCTVVCEPNNILCNRIDVEDYVSNIIIDDYMCDVFGISEDDSDIDDDINNDTDEEL